MTAAMQGDGEIEKKKTRTKFSLLISDMKINYVLYFLVLIPIAILIIFKYIPMYGVQIAFRDYKIAQGILGSTWVGMKNILKFFNSYNFGKIMGNTIKISLYSLATFPLSLILALMLNYAMFPKFKKTVQMVSYAPYFLSTVVMVGLILQVLDSNTGMLNALIGVFGIEPINFMAKPNYFYSIYIWSGIWQTIGYSSIIFIASLSSISPELHEAAIVDGATIMQRIRHIDLPGVMPTFSILLILRCGSILVVDFQRILLMQNNLNIGVAEVISTFVYKQGLASAIPQYSYASAIGLFTAVINLVMLLTVNFTVRKMQGTSLW